jgi:hypothetical protein
MHITYFLKKDPQAKRYHVKEWGTLLAGIYKLQLSPGTRIGLVSDFFLNLGKVFAKLCNALF